jgi:hypothetical protein
LWQTASPDEPAAQGKGNDMTNIFARITGWKALRLGTADEAAAEYQMRLEDARRHNCMASALAQTPIDYDAGRIPRYAAVEIKYNGISMIVTAGAALPPAAMTLEGVPMPCAAHLLADFEDMARALNEPMVFQAEYMVPGGFERTLGAFNAGQPSGFAVVFEGVPFGAWTGAEASAPLHERRRRLESAHGAARPQLVLLAQHAQGYDQEGIELAAGVAWTDGQEGIVVKDLEAPFIRRRDPSWMKLRRKQSDDLPIKQVMLNPDRTVMKIICDRPHEAGPARPIAVPHGFGALRYQPDEFRLGRMVEIAHEGVTKGGYLLSPRFARFRDDKGA